MCWKRLLADLLILGSKQKCASLWCGAGLRPGEGAVVVLLCGNEALCVVGCASGRVELGSSHSEHWCGTRLTNNVGELQAMCCAVL